MCPTVQRSSPTIQFERATVSAPGCVTRARMGHSSPKGEIDIVHVEPDGEMCEFTIQHANVHCTILGVRYLVTRDCSMTFHNFGRHITYPDGRRIRFVAKGGVVFVLLNVMQPGFPGRGHH